MPTTKEVTRTPEYFTNAAGEIIKGHIIVGKVNPTCRDQAEFIVRAVNSHDDLVAAVTDLINQPTWNRTLAPYEKQTLERARAALANA